MEQGEKAIRQLSRRGVGDGRGEDWRRVEREVHGCGMS
jgi:hypothetical protein